eukprot:11646125-Karenia_brevis.AAC.1
MDHERLIGVEGVGVQLLGPGEAQHKTLEHWTCHQEQKRTWRGLVESGVVDCSRRREIIIS